MKRPALLIAVCLAAGILCGPVLSARWSHPFPLCLAAAAAFLLLGFSLLGLGHERFGFVFALLAWFLLGAATLLAQPLQTPADDVTRLAAAGRLNLSEPLRWRGQLRADPLRLPWGLRYLIDLQQVQQDSSWIPVAGGLRANLYFDERQPADAPPLRAGNEVELLLRAEEVRNFADPGAFDYRAFLAQQDIQLTGTLRDASLLTSVPGPRASFGVRFRQRVARAHGYLIEKVDALLADRPDRAAVARAMLLGDRSFLDSEQIDTFQQTGAYHVLVVAGLHVGVLVIALLWICRNLRIAPLPSTLVVLMLLAAYVGVVEDRPPILRAALMATVFLLARLLFRRNDLLNVVGIAALALLAFRPLELKDASFLLSFLAALAIAGIALPLLERTTEPYVRALGHLGDVTRDVGHSPAAAQFRLDLRAARDWLAAHLPPALAGHASNIVNLPVRISLRIAELVLVSLVIQTGLLPLMAQYFHRISVVAPAVNLPALLLTGIIVPYGFATLAIDAIWPALGHLLSYGLSSAIAVLIASVHWFARPWWTSYRVPTPPFFLLWAFILAGVLFSATLLLNERGTSPISKRVSGWTFRWSSGAVLLSLGGLIAVYPFAPRLPRGRLEATVLDVGQGDSIFVSFPDGRTMLVDGGGLPGSTYVRGARPGLDVGEEVVSPYLWSRGIKRLDVIVLTHGHEDHLGGLPAVLRNFRVGALWVGRDVDSSAFRTLLATAKSRGVPVTHLKTGDDIGWDGVRTQVLWPPDDHDVKIATNDDSVVLRLEDGSEAMLLAGDIERPSERSLADSAELQPVDFLKVAHHGSRTSSTEAFLAKLRPRYAAISVGTNNPFGHPNAEALDRLSAIHAQVLRTDRNGAVTASTDGNTLEIHSFLAP